VTGPASRRYLAFYLPMLAEDCWRASADACSAADTDRPIVFTEKQANAVRLTALSRAALAIGLTSGLTLADARARVPELVAIERDHDAEARLLARVVAFAGHYTPMAQAEPPNGAVLDISGCLYRFGSEATLMDDVAARFSAGGVTLRLACGDTPEQARALARFGNAGTSQLHGLPVEALEADGAITLALRRAGLKTIGDLAVRPRRMLAARFGDLPIRLGRLLGEEDRRISPERALPPIHAVQRFAEPIGRVEDALACLEDLGHRVAGTLLERHEGGRHFVARFFRSDGRVLAVEVGTGRPTRDPAMLIRLFRERVDALADPIDPGFGFDLIRLDVPLAEPLAARQDDYTAPAKAEEDLAELVDRLSARLGPRRIHRTRPENTHIPECAATPCLPVDSPAWEVLADDEPPFRPLRMLDPPQPVGAVVSEVPDGPPKRFTWKGRTYSITHSEGPERIAAEWWRRRDRGGHPRDYYRVEDLDGHRFWLFRHGPYDPDATARWYLHGLFA
jgi:protein ImuB